MSTADDAIQVLQYVYLNRGETLTDQLIADASHLSLDEVQDALDELEDRLLVTLGVDRQDVEMTAEGRERIEEPGSFLSEFDTPLDLEEIAQEWESAD